MTCSQNSRQDQRWQTGETAYSEQMLFYIIFTTVKESVHYAHAGDGEMVCDANGAVLVSEGRCGDVRKTDNSKVSQKLNYVN